MIDWMMNILLGIILIIFAIPLIKITKFSLMHIFSRLSSINIILMFIRYMMIMVSIFKILLFIDTFLIYL
jgi:hypothetical protein